MHLDSLCVVRDVHARTPIMQMHTRALVEVRHTHTHILSLLIELPVCHFLHWLYGQTEGLQLAVCSH